MVSRLVSGVCAGRVVMIVLALVMTLGPGGGAAQGIKDADGTEEAAESGLMGDDTYVSPQFGDTVEWSDDWSPNEEETVSSAERGQDALRLGWSRPGGNIRMLWLEDGRGGPPEDVAWWSSDEYLDEAYAQVDAVEVLLQDPGTGNDDGAVLLGLADAGDPFAYVHYAQSVPVNGGGALSLMLDARLEDWPDALEAAQEGVTIDGEALFDVFPEDEVADALANAPSVPFSEEEAGLVGDGVFVSPAFGYEVTWPETWGLNPVVRVPVRSTSVVPFDEVHLAEDDPETDPPPFFDFYASYQRETTMEQELAVFVDPEWIALGFREEIDSTVLLQDTSGNEAEALLAVTIQDTGDVEYVWLRFARDGERADLYFYMKARSDDFEGAWDTMVTGEIALDGDPIETLFAWDDIEDAIAGFEGQGTRGAPSTSPAF